MFYEAHEIFLYDKHVSVLKYSWVSNKRGEVGIVEGGWKNSQNLISGGIKEGAEK